MAPESRNGAHGRYRTILIDPPWDNLDSITPKGPFSSYEGGWPYPTMRISEIEKLPIRELADSSGCHLYIWAMNSFVPHACYLMQHWGFKYSQILTWVKPSGVGHWWVSRTQHILFGYVGVMRMNTKHMPNVFGAPAMQHSRKPEISYELIEAVSLPPRVELFARYPREGWDVWGNEVKSTISLSIEAT
jgi:N6-adenosine-specific RNA methylase IME4